MSQEALAEAMSTMGYSFHRQTIDRIERGDRKLGMGEALALSRILRVSLDALVRPHGLQLDAWRLLDAARDAVTARKAITEETGRLRDAVHRLERAIRLAEEAGAEEDLADEIAVARRALKEARQ